MLLVLVRGVGVRPARAGRDCYETRAKVDKSHSIGKARVQLSSRCQLPAAASANLAAGMFQVRHEGVVIEIWGFIEPCILQRSKALIFLPPPWEKSHGWFAPFQKARSG